MRRLAWFAPVILATLIVLAIPHPTARDDSRSGPGSSPCAPALPVELYGYSSSDAPLPEHFLAGYPGTVRFSDNTPAGNAITNPGATLGRVLFYDVRLSADWRVSCASCHRQEFGFGDTARFSSGVYGRHPRRRTMALANARFYPRGRFFSDERAPSLEAQVLQPIQDSLEMGMELPSLVDRLGAEEFYRSLFAAAFGSPDVTAERIAGALAQFVRSLVSAGSRFDAVFATGGAPDEDVLTNEELEGFRLFDSVGCVNCHRTVAHFADEPHNTGLDSLSPDTGAGQGRFKASSLRNVAVRPPYMHDGRFATLRGVVEFYDGGVQPNRFLDPRLRAADGSPRRLRLTSRQRDAIVAFLGALTDSAFLTAERFSDPFACDRRTPEGRPSR